MSKQLRTIHNALPIVASAYGRKFGVKVALGTDTAYTDGETIVIPNVPEDHEHFDALWGYLAHEAAHVRFTCWEEVIETEGLAHHLQNIFEDGRIEVEMAKPYPGSRDTINTTMRYMVEEGHFRQPDDESSPVEIMTAYCLYFVRAKLLGQSVLSGHFEASESYLASTFPMGAQVRLKALLRKASNLDGTLAAGNLANEILRMLAEEAEKESPKPPSNSQSIRSDAGGSTTQSGDEGDDQSDAGGSSAQSDDDGDDQSDAGGSSAQSGDDGDDQSDAGGSTAKSGDDGDDQSDAGGSTAKSGDDGDGDSDQRYAALRQALGAGGDDLPADPFDAFRKEMDQVARRQGDDSYRSVREAKTIHPNVLVGKQMLNEVKQMSSRIRTQLMGLVQASNRTGRRTVRHGKRFETQHLHRLAAGDTRIFRREIDKPRPNTAVHILVDMSGSMGRCVNGQDKRAFIIAREAALALALALEPIPKVNPAVTFFGADEMSPVFNAVGHGESVSRNVGRFAFTPTGTTPMAEAVWYAAADLLNTKEERKLLIIVTDGDPNNLSSTQKVVGLCERGGVEVIGIGVGTRAVADFASNHVVISDVSDLQTTLFRLMESSLTVSAA